MEFLSNLLGGKFKAPNLMKAPGKKQGVGEYCGGKSLKECTKLFGDGTLPRICATCPD
jgi:hypothetical protein